MDTYEQIETYLQGDMSDKEQAAFKELLKADKQLSAAYNAYQQAHTYLKNEQLINTGEVALRATISNTVNQHKQNGAKPAKVVALNRRWLYGAAAAAACMLFFLMLKPLLFTTETNTQKLYSDNAVFEKFSATRGSGATDTLKLAAEMQFNAKQYTNAINTLNQYLQLQPGEIKYQLARAFAYIETGSYAQAEADLISIEKKSPIYKNQATWYRALSLLKQQKTDDCKKLLQTIPKGEDYYKQARDLINNLK